MLNLRRKLALWLRAVAQWLDAETPELDRDVVDFARDLVLRADLFSEGTSGEYKRHWVYARLLKTYPDVPKHTLGRVIEEAVGLVKR